MNKNPVFDGVRGLAFLIVLFMHSTMLSHPSTPRYLQGGGKYGVWLFFVLSSFLLTRNYLMPGAGKADYLIGRIIRIVPLYVICCLAYSYFGVLDLSSADWASVALVRYGDIHLWTIPVEFYFYMFLLGIWFIPSSAMRDALFGGCSALSAVWILLAHKGDNSINTLWYLPAFFVGYALARAWGKIPKTRHATLACLSILLVLVATLPGTSFLLFGIEPAPYLMNMYTPIALAWGVFIVAACKDETSFVFKVLSGRVMRFLGKISYSGYLFHWIVIVKINAVIGPSPFTGISSAVASVLVSAGIYYCLESRIMGIRRYLISPRQGSASSAGAVQRI